MSHCKLLEDMREEDFSSAGGKGANLGEMIRAGLPVPPGFVVLTSAYQDFVETNDLQEKIDKITENLRADDMTALQKASKEIYELFEQNTIPDAVISEISAFYKKQGRLVAVRSSATAEDLPGMSFAGQHSTYLNVAGSHEVCQAVLKCWASLWNARAISYRLKQGIPQDDLAIAVVVQQFVDGEKAGILFTAHPVSGRRDQMVINASWGLGEAVVGGAVSPDQWVVQKESGAILETHIAAKEVMTVRTEEGTKTTKTPEDLQEKPVLTQKEISTLNSIAKKTEAYFNFPQDIEWVFDDGKFYLVQTRPITSLFPLPQPEPDQKGLRVYFGVSLVGQGITEPMTPMGVEAFRLLYYGFSVIAWGGSALKYPDWVKTAAGRVYLDLTNLLGTKTGDTFIKGIAGKDPIIWEALNQFLEKKKDQISKGRSKIPPRLILLGLRLAGMMVYAFVNPEKAGKKMVASAEEEIHRLEQASHTLKGVEDRLRFIEEAAVDVMKMMVYQSTVFSVGFVALERAEQLLEKWLHNTQELDPVRQSLPYNPTTEMSMALLEISQKFKEQGITPTDENPEVLNFLEKYGHRAVLEIDMGLPRWKEDPEYVIDILNLYKEGDPQGKIKKFSDGVLRAEEAVKDIGLQVRKRKGRIHAWIINHLLLCYREIAGLRERPKFDLVRSFSIFRNVLQEVGKELVLQGRLDDKNDIFFVTFADIESGDNLRPEAAKNKEEYTRELNRKVVPRLVTSTGESVYTVSEQVKGKKLVGIPVSPGVYEGYVRIIHHPKGAQLESGEVLVTRSTDPAWTPLFINAGALIMETGGPISHGSIVAREYGIPAVANVVEATTRLETGQRIRVNGVSGEIVILD